MSIVMAYQFLIQMIVKGNHYQFKIISQYINFFLNEEFIDPHDHQLT